MKDIEKTIEDHTNAKIARDLMRCYRFVRYQFGDKFEERMADITAEIILLQHKIEDASFVEAGMLMTMVNPDESETAKARCKNSEPYIKAAIVWWILEENK